MSEGFIKKETNWKLQGRHGIEGDVEEIKGQNWKGIMGETLVGLFYKGGGYAGLGEESRAVISNGKRTAIISGHELWSKAGQDILKSIKFINNQKK